MITILFDGHCGLCRRTIRMLKCLDWLGVIRPADIHNEEERRRVAPEIAFADLDRVIHMKFSDGTTMTGFSAFRSLSWRIPLFWIFAPFLCLPGAKLIGDRVYAIVAARRKRCTHESCRY